MAKVIQMILEGGLEIRALLPSKFDVTDSRGTIISKAEINEKPWLPSAMGIKTLLEV